MRIIATILIIIFISFVAISFFFYYKNGSSPVSDSQKGVATQVVSQTPTSLISNPVQIIESKLTTSFNKTAIESLNRSFYPSSSLLPVLYEVGKYTVKYTSTDQNDNQIEITSQLFIPKTNNKQSFPIYVFGQGTTGLGDNCAPSKENVAVSNWGNYIAHMLSYASQGYIVMFPDYEGFNDPARLHHYFNANLEARVLLDGARATYQFFEKEKSNAEPEQAVFFAGYSQGGQSAFAAADLAKEYAPDVPIKGVVSYGGTTDMVNLLKENPTFAPYLVYAYSDFYGKDVVDPVQVLLSNLLPTLESDVTNICVGDIYRRYGYDAKKIYSQQFYDALYNDKLDQSYPLFKKVLDENNSGLSNNTVPSLTLQGTTDPIVTVKSQKEFLKKLCLVNENVTYKEYPGVHHYQTRQVSFKDSLTWMKQVANGQIPQTSCDDL